MDERDSHHYAIKIINVLRMKRMLTSKVTTGVDSLEQEIDILKTINNSRCVGLKEVIGDEEDDKVYIITEYMRKGSLAFYMKKNTLAPEQIRSYFRDLILGVEYLHGLGIVHRDIKPENLLISDDDVLKITDFGISERIIDGKDVFTNSAGTNYYFSPESCRGVEYSGKSADIWA